MMRLSKRWKIMRTSVKSLWRRQSIWKNSKELSRGHREQGLSRTCPDSSRSLGPHHECPMEGSAICRSWARSEVSLEHLIETDSSVQKPLIFHQWSRTARQPKLRSFIKSTAKLSKRILHLKNKYILLMFLSSFIFLMTRLSMTQEKRFVKFLGSIVTNSWSNQIQVNTVVKKKTLLKTCSSSAVVSRILNWNNEVTTS